MTTETRPGLHTLAQLQTRHSNATQASTVRIELPIPTSTNMLTRPGRNGVGKFDTDEYKQWKADAAGYLLSAPRAAFSVPVEITLTLEGGSGFSTARDADNCVKAVFDFLVNSNIIEGDTVKHIPKHTVQYVQPPAPKQPARCWVEIREAV